jgi:hypothetical protein
MTDRELLERAAKAAGIDGQYESWTGMGFMQGIRPTGQPKSFKIWNSLMYEDQAARLSSKLRMNITHSAHAVRAWTDDDAPAMVDETVFVVDESKRIVAMCQAITRAAAAMAEGKG